MNLATALEQAEDRHLSCGPSAAFALTRAAKVALVDLDLAAEEGGLPGQVLDDQLAQLVVDRTAVLRFTPTSSVAVRAGTLATNWTTSAR